MALDRREKIDLKPVQEPVNWKDRFKECFEICELERFGVISVDNKSKLLDWYKESEED